MNMFNKIYAKTRIWVILLLAVALPFLTSNDYFLHVANLALIFAILSLSLNLLTGCTGLFSVGHIAFYGIGAYTSAILTTKFNLPIIVGFVAAGIVAALFSLLLGMPTIRLRGLYLAVATLAFGEIMYQVFVNWDAVTNGTRGIKGVPSPEIFGISFRSYGNYYYIILLVTIACIVLCKNLINSRPGRALLAIRENDVAAEAMGVNPVKFKLIAFVISAFMAGIAGALYAHEVHFISPETFVGAESSAILAMMVVGGIGSIPGSVLGGIVLTVIPEFLRSFGDIRLILYGAAIVAIIIFAPKGLGGLVEWIDGLLMGKIKLGEHKKNTHGKEADE